MAIFKKRTTVIENITYMGIMASINVIFCLLSTLVPWMVFLLVFLLPFSSAIVSFYCKKKFYPIYAIATIGLCALCTLWNIADVIFYVVPSVITGFIFGLLFDRKVSPVLIITCLTLIQALLTYPTLLLVKTIYPGVDVLEALATIFKLNDYEFLPLVKNVYVFLISLIQMLLTYVLIASQGEKIGLSTKTTKNDELYNSIGLIGGTLLTIIFCFIGKEIVYVPFVFMIVFALYEVVLLIYKAKKWPFFVIGGSILLTLFVNAIMYSSLPAPLHLVPICLFFITVGIIGLINNCLLNTKRKIK